MPPPSPWTIEAEATNDTAAAERRTADRPMRYYISTCQKNVKAANHVEEEDNYRGKKERQREREGKGGNGIIERFLPFRALEGPPNSSVSPPNAIPSHYSTKAKSENVVERVASISSSHLQRLFALSILQKWYGEFVRASRRGKFRPTTVRQRRWEV